MLSIEDLEGLSAQYRTETLYRVVNVWHSRAICFLRLTEEVYPVVYDFQTRMIVTFLPPEEMPTLRRLQENERKKSGLKRPGWMSDEDWNRKLKKHAGRTQISV